LTAHSSLESSSIEEMIKQVVESKRKYLLLKGNCRKLLEQFPEKCVDCVITSPPYWKMRVYDVEPEYMKDIIGAEDNPDDYVANIVAVLRKIKKILRPTGSVWLNIGDKYLKKNLMGMPWRVALAMEKDGWILRNDVIWNKMKGTQSAKDRLRSNHEHFFHFVKEEKYFYDYNKILVRPEKSPTVEKDKVVSATGVSGKKYREQIQNSKDLNENDQKAALMTLENVLQRIRKGELVDFRMTIRGNQRALHSNHTRISGRAKELEERGFYVLTSKTKGFIPADIWNIVPEDEWRKDVHYAVFPVDLLRIPIKATCPEGGLVLDPFMGIGSAIVAAVLFSKRAIGIEVSQKYVDIAKQRLQGIQIRFSSFTE